MISLTMIRNSGLAIVFGLLLFAEFLHPVFHQHDSCFMQENQYCTAEFPDLMPVDGSLMHGEYACSICATMFMKYCFNNSILTVACSYHESAVLLSLDFVFVETNITGSPRAPPGTLV